MILSLIYLRFQVVTCLDEHWDQVNDEVDTWGNFTANNFDRNNGFSIVFVARCKPLEVKIVNVKFEQMLTANHQFNAVFSIVPYVPFRADEAVTSDDEADKDFVVDDEIEEDDDDEIEEDDDDEIEEDDDDEGCM
jgi:hypothetical protein